MKIFLSEELGEVTMEVTEPSNSIATIIIAHGAGAGMHNPFMVDLADQLSDLGVRAIRFNFPYMESGRKSPGSPKKNIQTWSLITRHVNKTYPDAPIFLSGKSYGGRMASHMIAEESDSNVTGLVYFGFPLHAPGRDSKDRAAHLIEIGIPQLFLQGTKDKLANFSMMEEVVGGLNEAKLIALSEADHSFNVPKRVGLTKAEMTQLLAKHTVDFINKNL